MLNAAKQLYRAIGAVRQSCFDKLSMTVFLTQPPTIYPPHALASTSATRLGR